MVILAVVNCKRQRKPVKQNISISLTHAWRDVINEYVNRTDNRYIGLLSLRPSYLYTLDRNPQQVAEIFTKEIE